MPNDEDNRTGLIPVSQAKRLQLQATTRFICKDIMKIKGYTLQDAFDLFWRTSPSTA